MKIISLIFIFFILHSLFFIHNSFAQTMSNSSYTIEEGNLNSFAGQATGSNYTVNDTGGGLAPGIYTGTNYKIRANFGYGDDVSTSSSGFTFSISNTSLSFGKITAGEPIIRTNNLSVASPTSAYQVIASENKPLTNATGATIPNTTCDDGNCTSAISAIWTSPLTYGFGYRCDNSQAENCAGGFTEANFYKQFSTSTASQSGQIIMASNTPISNATSQISYKLNISGSQPAGTYQNDILYIATPSL